MARLASGPRQRGRDRELRTLGEAHDRVASGGSAVMLVEGEAGIGKSRLLAEALEQARARSLSVAAGPAEELERTRPFGLLADALGCVRLSPDRAAPPSPPSWPSAPATGPDDGEQRPGAAVPGGRRLRRPGGGTGPRTAPGGGPGRPAVGRPLQPAHAATLGRRLADLPVALIGCLRPFPHPHELARTVAALQAAGAQRLTLGQLDQRAVVGLVAEAVAAQPGPELLAEVAGARGNPLFVTELVPARLQEGAVRTVEGRAEVASSSLPPSLRLTILRRLGLLPDDTLQALRSAAILGSSFALTELSAFTGRPMLELSAVLAEAIRARVLEDDGERLRFRHDLIHEAIYQDLPPGVRLGLHREAGQRLAESGASALRVAAHLARGATRGDADAIAWLSRAAREATPRSPAVAAELLEQAIELVDPADPARDALVVERAGALMWAGRVHDAKTACRSLLERDHDPSVEGPARICLAWIFVAEGRMRDTLREVELVHRSPGLSDQARGSAWAWAGMAQVSLGDLDGAAAAAEQARPAAVTRGHILMELDRLQEAGRTLETGRRTSQELGVRWPLASYQVFLGMSPRTVQTHLAHIFAKLGVSTRARLAAQAAHQQAR